MKFNKISMFSFAILTICMMACSDGNILTDTGDVAAETPDVTADSEINPTTTDEFIARGGDVSWISEMQDQGYKFYFANGKEGDPIEILRDLGMNTFRFRVWVDPGAGYNSLADVVEKAERAWKSGAQIMIDFHYSDSWADPGQQNIPAAWKNYNLEQMCEAVANHTISVLNALKDKGIKVRWVQVGNETSNGMLWPMGKADTNPANYAKLNNAGYDAVKEVFPEAQVIIHLANAQKQNDAEWLFGLLDSNSGKWDIMGFSLYPEPTNYVSMLTLASNTIKALTQKYNRPAMLCEVGMGESYQEECYAFLKKCFDLETEIPSGMYVGTLYWEPQCYGNFNGYKKGAFTSQGRPGKGLDAYGGFSSVPIVTAD